MYELFEHTADLGIRAIAADLDTLFQEAARGLFSAIVEDFDAIQPRDCSSFEIAGTDREFLLFDWLKELLYLADAEHRLFSRFSVTVSETGLTGQAWGETLDPSRHILSHEVKAITYHELKIEPVQEGWLAEVIIDI